MQREQIAELEAQLLAGDKTSLTQLTKVFHAIKNASTDTATVIAGIRSLGRIFLYFAANGDLKSMALHTEEVGTSEPGAAQRSKRAKHSAKEAKKLSSAQKSLAMYTKYVHGKYVVFVKLLLVFVHEQVVPVQACALHTLMDLVAVECEVRPAQRLVDGLFGQVVAYLVTHPDLREALLMDFVGKFVAKYRDVWYYFLSNLRRTLSVDLNELCQEMLLTTTPEELAAAHDRATHNAFDMLMAVSGISQPTVRTLVNLEIAEARTRAAAGDDGEDRKRKRSKGTKASSSSSLPEFGGIDKASQHLSIAKSNADIQRMYSRCWMALLRLPTKLSVPLYKRVLRVMHSHILPHLESPLLVSDFLTDSYNAGGVVSILSLEALFYLMSHHTLDYPEFYPRLYALLQPHIFHTKYRVRFFKLVDLFLRSMQLPATLVAAFAKRLGRLSLTAPPAGCVFILSLVYNLLLRHPACRVLIHRPLAGTTMPNTSESAAKMLAKQQAMLTSNPPPQQPKSSAPADGEGDAKKSLRGFDPFLADESDPYKCRAMESSLWELSTLTNHYEPVVARLAQLFGAANAPKKEFQVTEYGAYSYEKLFHKQLGWRANQRMPLEFERPSGLFPADESAAMNFGVVSAAARAASAAAEPAQEDEEEE